MEKIIGTVPGKCRKKREKARLTLNNNPEISWHMKNRDALTMECTSIKNRIQQDVVEQSLTFKQCMSLIVLKSSSSGRGEIKQSC